MIVFLKAPPERHQFPVNQKKGTRRLVQQWQNGRMQHIHINRKESACKVIRISIIVWFKNFSNGLTISLCFVVQHVVLQFNSPFGTTDTKHSVWERKRIRESETIKRVLET